MSAARGKVSVVTPEQAGTLGGLFRERVARTPDAVAYRHFDPGSGTWQDTTWAEMQRHVARWQAALGGEGLAPGDRIGIMMRNCREWVMFDQAALGLGLITVPVYADDRGGNVAYIAKDAEVRVLFIGGEEEWERIEPVRAELASVKHIVSRDRLENTGGEERLVALEDWLPAGEHELQTSDASPEELASIVYTSGTTGFPKGVMLSHRNILSNAGVGAELVDLGPEDTFLSFLPLSHTLERTGGYYLPMVVGSTVAYARSILDLAEDLQTIRPTALISVPRIYERVYARVQAGLEEKGGFAKKLFTLAVAVGWARFLNAQGRGPWKPNFLLWPLLNALVAKKLLARLGGRLKVAVSGGAPLTPDIARTFIGLGVPILQGYGLTETSPVISANTLEDNVPESVGKTVPGVEVKIAANEELWARGPNVMLGYWNNREATERVLDTEGWLHTGDKARIDEAGHIYITGRLKEIIVLSNGEKVSPADMEMAIAMDPLVEQVMVIGEGRPYLSTLIVLEGEAWGALARSLGVDAKDEQALTDQRVQEAVLGRIAEQVKLFPGYCQVRRAYLTLDPWTIENGLLTPTMKLKRNKVLEALAEPVEELYVGH